MQSTKEDPPVVNINKCKKQLKIVKRSRDGGAKSMHTRM